jgi:hypothetical protein
MLGVGILQLGRTRIVMRHAAVTIVRIGLLLGLFASSHAGIAAEADDLDRARALIAARNERQAAEILEDALADAGRSDRDMILSLLRQTYTDLARQAQAKGQDREAALYQDNLAILNHETVAVGPSPDPGPPSAPAGTDVTPERPRQSAPPSKPTPSPVSADPDGPPARPIPPPQRLPKPDPLPPSASSPPQKQGAAARIEAEPRLEGPTNPTAEVSPDTGHRLRQADHAFASKQYEVAGRLYAQLAARKELPANRNEVWAYCRWTDIVRRINAKPRTAEEWDAIEAEIKRVRELTPNNWYGEYLLSRVAEARKTRRSLFPMRARNQKLLVRGSEPEEIDVTLPNQSTPKPTPKAESRAPQPLPDVNGTIPGPAQPPVAASSPTSPDGRWLVQETPNFRIFHHSPELAAQAARAAESVRFTQGKRWTSPALSRSWNPKCEVYLYPEAKAFSKMTGQPESSPGFTTMAANGGRIISRRVNLRADHPQVLSAILPHEITHVVLADLFPEQPIPRWADEGMAVLAEPPAELRSRSAELNLPLQENRVFAVADLVALDYPDAKDWSTYYAQSISLTRFLVEQGQPRDFIRFLQALQRSGIDAALRETYKINDLAELQNLWLTYARDQASGADVAAADPAPGAETR